MKELQDEINEVWDLAVFLQMIAFFSAEIEINEFSEKMSSFYEIIKSNDDTKIKNELTYYKNLFNKLFAKVKLKYPLKKNYRDVATEWNAHFRENKDFPSYGIMIGWLEEQIDLKNYLGYDYMPYHFKVGLYIHKGRGEIEENFLLLDAFSSLVKAKKKLSLLENYSEQEKEKYEKAGLKSFRKEVMDILNLLKYETSFYSRTTIINFFSFFECFVNSIGYDYILRNKNNLSEKELITLKGFKDEKGRFLSLENKIENFQKIMRKDKNVPIKKISDNNELFAYYKELRNSSVHFAPNKTSIWLKPHDWVKKAEKISVLVLESSINFWKSCHNTNKGPDYLGRLEYDKLYEIADERERMVNDLYSQINENAK